MTVTRSDPWPRNSTCHGAAKKEKKKKTSVEGVEKLEFYIAGGI